MLFVSKGSRNNAALMHLSPVESRHLLNTLTERAKTGESPDYPLPTDEQQELWRENGMRLTGDILRCLKFYKIPVPSKSKNTRHSQDVLENPLSLFSKDLDSISDWLTAQFTLMGAPVKPLNGDFRSGLSVEFGPRQTWHATFGVIANMPVIHMAFFDGTSSQRKFSLTPHTSVWVHFLSVLRNLQVINNDQLRKTRTRQPHTICLLHR